MEPDAFTIMSVELCWLQLQLQPGSIMTGKCTSNCRIMQISTVNWHRIESKLDWMRLEWAQFWKLWMLTSKLKFLMQICKSFIYKVSYRIGPNLLIYNFLLYFANLSTTFRNTNLAQRILIIIYEIYVKTFGVQRRVRVNWAKFFCGLFGGQLCHLSVVSSRAEQCSGGQAGVSL